MTTDHSRYGPAALELSRDEVHVWCAAFDAWTPDLQRLASALSPEERCRAERFHFLRDRQRYIAARGLLRILLSRYTGLSPSQLRFAYGPYGKPSLATGAAHEGLQFNLSHTRELVLYAVTLDRPVGIDVERVHPMEDAEAVAERFFSAREKAALRTLAPELRQDAFFACWTRKEAYIKARGEGLSFPLDAFDVSVMPGEPAALLRTRGDPLEASRWSMQDLRPGAGYKAALVAEGHSWHLVYRPWTC